LVVNSFGQDSVLVTQGSILRELEVTSLIILDEAPIIESWELRCQRPGTKIYVFNMDEQFQTKFI
jgi:hypothetical protein